VGELNRAENIDLLLFLLETHSSADNEVERGMSWTGPYFFNHGTSLSAGIAVLFSQRLHLTNVSACNAEQGRLQSVQATISDIAFAFINVCAVQ